MEFIMITWLVDSNVGLSEFRFMSLGPHFIQLLCGTHYGIGNRFALHNLFRNLSYFGLAAASHHLLTSRVGPSKLRDGYSKTPQLAQLGGCWLGICIFLYNDL